MKKILTLAAAAWLLGTLAGCAVYTPGASVVIDPVPQPQGRGNFCPPGQAKKGNC